jgi:predicted membrane channel-forming protein YqfA (hemolysin III family)
MSLKRNVGQKFSLISSVVCAVMMLPAFAAFIWMWSTRGLADTWTPSLLAVVGFFASCAVVFYFMSRPQPPLPVDDSAVDSKIH